MGTGRNKREQHATRRRAFSAIAAIMLALTLAPNAALADMLPRPARQHTRLRNGFLLFFARRKGVVVGRRGQVQDLADRARRLSKTATIAGPSSRSRPEPRPPAYPLTFQHGAKGCSLVIDGSCAGMRCGEGHGHDDPTAGMTWCERTPAATIRRRNAKSNWFGCAGKPATAECARRDKAKLDLISAAAMARRNRRGGLS